MGRLMGIEPTNAGTTNRSLNHLATTATSLIVTLNTFIYNQNMVGVQVFFEIIPKFPEFYDVVVYMAVFCLKLKHF
jgi:hypothetical protein